MGTLRAPTRCSSLREHGSTLSSEDIRNKEGLADLSVPLHNMWSAQSIRRLESLTTWLLILGVLS
jgi:hypothetical protein